MFAPFGEEEGKTTIPNSEAIRTFKNKFYG